MKKYDVSIEEIVCETFEVEAESLEDAIEIARAKYHNGEFVLEPGELVETQLMARDTETEEETNWIEI